MKCSKNPMNFKCKSLVKKTSKCGHTNAAKQMRNVPNYVTKHFLCVDTK